MTAPNSQQPEFNQLFIVLLGFVIFAIISFVCYKKWYANKEPLQFNVSNTQESRPEPAQRFQLAVPNAFYALFLLVVSIIFPFGMLYVAKQRAFDTSGLLFDLSHLMMLMAFLLYTPSTLQLQRGLEWIGWLLLCLTEWFYYEPKINSLLKILGEIMPEFGRYSDKLLNFQNHAWELLKILGPEPNPNNDSKYSMIGVWVHMGYNTGTFAEGCLTIWKNQWGEFMRGINEGGGKGNVYVHTIK